MSTILSIHGLAKSFRMGGQKLEVLRQIDLDVVEGEILSVVGRSGSGKTTLLELIAGLASPDQGQISWQGSPTTARQRRWLSGLVFQFPERHFIGLTVGQELKLGHRRLSSECLQQALAQVGLAGLPLTQAPERLSGGQQRRLALAVQLLREPGILLLDELQPSGKRTMAGNDFLRGMPIYIDLMAQNTEE